VVKYSLEIAREMGVGEDEQRTLKYAAFLHDIGKIEISRDILNKRGPLTEEEKAVIRQHTLFGVSIIEPIHSLESIVAAVLYHHERWDGDGYPGGISGEEIPLMARILAVADSFDAMVSNRPYRDGLSLPEAEVELENCAGTQFDPRVVRAFLAACHRPGSDLLVGAEIKEA
jgi:putative nucleotidyltransferase with HDIG domain